MGNSIPVGAPMVGPRAAHVARHCAEQEAIEFPGSDGLHHSRINASLSKKEQVRPGLPRPSEVVRLTAAAASKAHLVPAGQVPQRGGLVVVVVRTIATFLVVARFLLVVAFGFFVVVFGFFVVVFLNVVYLTPGMGKSAIEGR